MTEPSEPDLRGALVDGTFRVLDRIGRGAMGTVYHALDVRLDRSVALKVLRNDLEPEFTERFTVEAKAMASVVHPGLVTVYSFGRDGDLHYMALELVAGRTVHDLLREAGGPLAPGRACDIGAQVLGALAEVHERGIVHRDVKPANIMCVPRAGRDQVKVLDFGLAKLRRARRNITSPNVILGTPTYISPEQVRGDPIGPRTDVYQAGVVIFEMLAGRPPFQSEEIHALLAMHARDAAPPLRAANPALPEPLERVLACALEKVPEARFTDARAFADALRRAAATLSEPQLPV